MESNLKRKEIRFYGYVQGVGFRYRAQYAANSVGVTGWVRNEWDGSVLMEIQGNEQQLDEVLRRIKMGTYIEIDRVESREIPLEEQEGSFHVR